MPGESAISLARDVKAVVDKHEIRLDILEDQFDKLGIEEFRERQAQFSERLAVLEHRVNELARLEADIRRIAVIEDRVAELKRLKDEADRRFWQFVVLFVGGLITLAINFTLTFLRK